MVKWKEVSEIYKSEKERIQDPDIMLKNKVLEIFNRCHVLGKLIIWNELAKALQYEPFWMMDFRAKSVIQAAREVTTHKEFYNGK